MSENEKNMVEFHKNATETKIQIERIFKHSEDIKLSLKEVIYKIEQANRAINQKDIDSRERDNIIEYRFNKEIKSLYKAVSFFGLASLASLIGGILVFLANTNNDSIKKIISMVVF